MNIFNNINYKTLLKICVVLIRFYDWLFHAYNRLTYHNHNLLNKKLITESIKHVTEHFPG